MYFQLIFSINSVDISYKALKSYLIKNYAKHYFNYEGTLPSFSIKVNYHFTKYLHIKILQPISYQVQNYRPIYGSYDIINNIYEQPSLLCMMLWLLAYLLLLLLSVAKLALEALDLSVAKKPRFLDELFSFEALILKKTNIFHTKNILLKYYFKFK